MTKILIVDDNSENLYLLRAILEGHGYAVEEARNGEEALGKARAGGVRIAISDLMMPVMDGFTLLRHWRSDDRLRRIPFIVYTATYTEPRDERLAMSLGADAFIVKPAEPETFMAEVRSILEKEKRGELQPASAPPLGETDLIEEYNAVLIRKLEKKAQELERKNRELRAEIAERQSVDEKLGRTQSQLESLVTSIDGVVYEADAKTFRFTFVSPQAEKLLGFPLSDWIDKEDFWVERVHPDDREKTVRLCRERTDRGENHTFECRLIAADGRVVWVRDLVTYVEEPGSPPCLRGLMVDMTEFKTTEEVLRLRDRAIQAVSQGILITDPNLPDNPIVYASAGFEKITGYRSEEVIGKNCRFLQGKETDPRAVAEVRAAIRERRPCSVEILNYRKDGKSFWCQLTLSPVWDDEGRLTHFVGVQSDVTARRKLEAQLQQSQKMEAVGRLAGGVAHDFNNLLTIISGYSNLLLSADKWDDMERESLSAIKEAGERATDLTRQLLGFSRRTLLAPKVLDMNAVVTETGKMLRRLIGEDIHFTTVLGRDLHRVCVDPGQLNQVLMNLAVNARDAMPTGGQLTVETANVNLSEDYALDHPDCRPGPHVMLAISDTGRGMAHEMLDRIFEPFFTTKEVGKGTGLGLAMVFGIVRQSGGTIHVYSEPGHGTTFKIYFPAVFDEAAVESFTPPEDERGGSETILLVEDEEAVRKLSVKCLEKLGYRILTAKDGEEAVHACDSHDGPIDLVLTDVVMPNLGGPGLVARLRERFPDVKVLFMSGYTDDVVVRHGLLEENVSFIQKPYTPQGLAAKVRQVLDQKEPSARTTKIS